MKYFAKFVHLIHFSEEGYLFQFWIFYLLSYLVIELLWVSWIDYSLLCFYLDIICYVPCEDLILKTNDKKISFFVVLVMF